MSPFAFFTFVVELIHPHHRELVRDFRTFYGLSFYDIGTGYTWAEGYTLATKLLADPSSHTAAAVNGWDYSITGTEAAILRLIDIFKAANTSKGKKMKPEPRPWDRVEKAKNTQTHGSLAELSEEEKQQHAKDTAELLQQLRSGEGLTGWEVKITQTTTL